MSYLILSYLCGTPTKRPSTVLRLREITATLQKMLLRFGTQRFFCEFYVDVLVSFRAAIFVTFYLIGYLVCFIHRKFFNWSLTILSFKNSPLFNGLLLINNEYKQYLDSYHDKIVDILSIEGKKTLGDQVHAQTLSFASFIYTDNYFLTTLDLWLLVLKYKIPIIKIIKILFYILFLYRYIGLKIHITSFVITIFTTNN